MSERARRTIREIPVTEPEFWLLPAD